MFYFREYNNLQIKQKHNSQMLYESYLEVLHRYHLQYRYKMLWQRHKDGYQLLAKENLTTGKREYLGRRNEQTEAIAENFRASKQQIKERLKMLKERLKRDEKLNKFEKLGRVPKELIAILRKVNELDLDKNLIVIGTNSLYAYEAKAGVMIEEEYLATEDIDLLNRRQKGLSFLFHHLHADVDAILLLQAIDKSFYQSPNIPYRFINQDGVWVELLTPASSKGAKSELFNDILPLEMDGMQWLENARLFQETVIGTNGKTATMTTIHPLEFAIYKNWLSTVPDRNILKKNRDYAQAKLVTQLIEEYMVNIDIDAELKRMKHFKKEVVEAYKQKVLP
jgi:hypothetical protein